MSVVCVHFGIKSPFNCLLSFCRLISHLSINILSHSTISHVQNYLHIFKLVSDIMHHFNFIFITFLQIKSFFNAISQGNLLQLKNLELSIVKTFEQWEDNCFTALMYAFLLCLEHCSFPLLHWLPHLYLATASGL